MHTSIATRAALLLAIAVAGIGCGDDESLPSASAEIGAAGGALTGPAGTAITIPAGAVTSTTTITVTQMPRSTPPAGTALVAEPIRLGPDGKTFEKPVEITITVDMTALPAGRQLSDVRVMRAPQGTKDFVSIPTRAQGGNSVVAVTEHFSDFITVVSDPNAMLDGGSPFGLCGDSQCVGGETCSTCPYDCALCFMDTVDVCFDGVCNGSETNATCPYDCTTPALGDCSVNNGGCDLLASCSPIIGGVACTCLGNTIDQLGDGTLCTTAGPCDVESCYTGTCVDYAGNHYCMCAPGYANEVCSDIIDCTIFNGGCDLNATCTQGTGSVTCACNLGYTGSGYFCTPDTGAICGDGIPDISEMCDDANTTSGDGCDATCQVESGFDCPMPGLPCYAICGDTMVVGGEQCDDGNPNEGDGCAPSCTIEYGWECAFPGNVCTTTCGDGIVAGFEVCDDGNVFSEDGCEATCASVESGYTCPPTGGICLAMGCDYFNDVDPSNPVVFTLTSFGLAGLGLNLDELDDSGAASIPGCGVLDQAGGLENAYLDAANGILGIVDLAAETQAFFGSMSAVTVAVDRWNGTADDSCVSVTVRFTDASMAYTETWGAGSIVGDQVQARFDVPLAMNQTWSTPTGSTCNTACTPATMYMMLYAPAIDFSMDTGHTAITGGTFGGAYFFGDVTPNYIGLNVSGLEYSLSSYAAAADLTTASHDALAAAFLAARDIHLNGDGSRGICTGPSVTAVNPNAISVGFSISSQ